VALRDVVEINEDLCDGCGDCVTACAEGAITVIDGKARLVSDIYCDGLGACLGHCPQGAITVTRREAAEFDEAAVAKRLETLGSATAAPAARPLTVFPVIGQAQAHGGGCPGSRATMRDVPPIAGPGEAVAEPSQLRHWPVQLHLVPPTAPFFHDTDVLLAADCVAFAVADFHRRHLAGRSLAIACPKLDSHQEIYLEKLVAMIDRSGIRSLRVMVMEVPCCGGLVRLAEEAVHRAKRKIPVDFLVVGTGGQILGASPIVG
jgi:NAD-dependent dihydropyrimidine dehydrogenase PreA subunit